MRPEGPVAPSRTLPFAEEEPGRTVYATRVWCGVGVEESVRYELDGEDPRFVAGRADVHEEEIGSACLGAAGVQRHSCQCASALYGCAYFSDSRSARDRKVRREAAKSLGRGDVLDSAVRIPDVPAVQITRPSATSSALCRMHSCVRSRSAF
ncbi:hypothetical protein AOLI_G00053790 [Acnodon oligacanthus]